MTAHPDYEKIIPSIDMRDIESDGWLWFQRRYEIELCRKKKRLKKSKVTTEILNFNIQQILLASVDNRGSPTADKRARRILGRVDPELSVCSWLLPTGCHCSSGLAHQQRHAHMGPETRRQVNTNYGYNFFTNNTFYPRSEESRDGKDRS